MDDPETKVKDLAQITYSHFVFVSYVLIKFVSRFVARIYVL